MLHSFCTCYSKMIPIEKKNQIYFIKVKHAWQQRVLKNAKHIESNKTRYRRDDYEKWNEPVRVGISIVFAQNELLAAFHIAQNLKVRKANRETTNIHSSCTQNWGKWKKDLGQKKKRDLEGLIDLREEIGGVVRHKAQKRWQSCFCVFRRNPPHQSHRSFHFLTNTFIHRRPRQSGSTISVYTF